MPGITIPTRRRHSTAEDASDSNADGNEVSEDDTLNLTSANKRARLSRANATAHDPVDDSWALSPPPPPTVQRNARATATPGASTIITNPRDSGVSLVGDDGTHQSVRQEHHPGSIVRVTLENFVTYTSASFNPGPGLNMVIGPNGTGKSTLVCAICLGLGWSPSHLGRAKELGEFVKHGCSDAMIEIELKGNPGKRNQVIRRIIKKDGNKTSFTLNGQTSTQKNVRNVAEKFSIQIDNLCQFLPQDRVVEFSAMNPRELLASTQRAAADPEMSAWHEQLKQFRVDQKRGESEQTDMKAELTNLEHRQRQQQADVDRMQERADAVKKIELLEQCRPWAVYWTSHAEYESNNESLSRVTEEHKRLKDEERPNLKAVHDKEVYEESIKKAVVFKKNMYERGEKEVDKCKKKITDVATEITKIQNNRSAEKRNANETKKKIGGLNTEITGIKADMQNPPEEYDHAACNEKTREYTRESRACLAQYNEISTRISERTKTINEKNQSIKNYDQEIKNLQSQAGQQEEKLKRASRDTYQAWQWVKQNRDKLKGEVYGPPIVSCSVKDRRYVDLVEAKLQPNHFITITCTHPDDYHMLHEQFHDVMGLNHVPTRQMVTPLSHFRPPVDDAERERLGFDGWAIDYVEGPEPVLVMLCEDGKLNRTGLMLRDGNPEHYRLVEQSPVTEWVSSKSEYSITRRREYGPQASSTRVKNIRPANFWTDSAVDTGQERALKEKINDLNTEVEVLTAEQDKDRKESKVQKQNQEMYSKKWEELAAEKAEKQAAQVAFNVLPVTLSEKENQLMEAQGQLADYKKTLDEFIRAESDCELRKGQAAINLCNSVDAWRGLHKALIIACIAQIEAQSDVTILKQRNQRGLDLLEQKKNELLTLRAEKQRLKNVVKKAMADINKIVEEQPEVREFYESLPEEERNRAPEELDTELESLRARVDLLHEGNPRILREYEERKDKISALQQRLADKDAALAGTTEQIAELRARWEPALEALIAQISAAFSACFDKIDCAGEVRLHKDGPEGRDFDTWAVHVHVKFREAEAMSLLDSHRQSGGERAVSTVFYLMALQSLSRAPFRVVDEINQGMDPRNERLVHERMVDIACGEDASSGASQYFLITPKLLTGLKYAPGMKIHCIASGERMPTDYNALDFKRLLERAKRLKLSGAAVGT